MKVLHCCGVFLFLFYLRPNVWVTLRHAKSVSSLRWIHLLLFYGDALQGVPVAFLPSPSPVPNSVLGGTSTFYFRSGVYMGFAMIYP
jgi:hypothetical protein